MGSDISAVEVSCGRLVLRTPQQLQPAPAGASPRQPLRSPPANPLRAAWRLPYK